MKYGTWNVSSYRPADVRVMVEAAKLSRELLGPQAFDAFRGAPIFPERDDLSDAELADFIRAKAETIYHPAGTMCVLNPPNDPAPNQVRAAD